MKDLINIFSREAECDYKKEHYSVRDNGAVFRHARVGKRLRKYDNQWTFGKPNKKTGYLEIASVRVHRIVATAFYGEPPTKEHVVDHIDTNKHNNRPENLRWVTRLENVLLNPITRKRIEFACGCSIKEFLANPSKFRENFREPNYKWMTTVSKEEAQLSLERLTNWAKKAKKHSGGTLDKWIFNDNPNNASFEKISHDSLVERIYRDTRNYTSFEDISDLIFSNTPNAIQKKWRTPSEFPCCPQGKPRYPIEVYANNIKSGDVFSRNKYSSTVIQDFAVSEDKKTLWILCKNSENNAIKPWLLAKVTYEKNLFVHTNLGSFFEKAGAEKEFTLVQGHEWLGEDSVDDFS